MKYTENDLISLFNYMKENNDKTIEDWKIHNNSKLTNDEKKSFALIEMATELILHNGCEYKFYFIKWNGALGGGETPIINRFIQKRFNGEAEYIFSNNRSYIAAVTTSKDFYHDEYWNVYEDDGKKIEGLYTIGNNKIKCFLDGIDPDDKNSQLYYKLRNQLEGSSDMYYMETDSGWVDIFVDDVYELEYKPVLDFFN